MKKIIFINNLLFIPYLYASVHNTQEHTRYPHGIKAEGSSFIAYVDLKALEHCWKGHKEASRNLYKYSPPKGLILDEQERRVCEVAQIRDRKKRNEKLKELLKEARENNWSDYLIYFIEQKLKKKKSFIERIKSKSF